MRLSIGAIFFLFISLTACQEKKTPECLIPKAQMASIMTELHVAEKHVEFQGFPRDSAEMAFHAIYKKETLRKHNVSLKCFETSYNYYMNNVEELNDVYKLVVDSLILKESLIEMEDKKRKAKANSGS